MNNPEAGKTEATRATVEELLSTHLTRLDTDEENGLAKLVLSLIDLLHRLLEAQALRRIDEGTLSDDQTERVGGVLMQQAHQIDALCKEFGLKPEDLAIHLGPLIDMK